MIINLDLYYDSIYNMATLFILYLSCIIEPCMQYELFVVSHQLVKC